VGQRAGREVYGDEDEVAECEERPDGCEERVRYALWDFGGDDGVGKTGVDYCDGAKEC